MEEKAVRGARWTTLSVASNKIITLGTTIVLARLLVPSDLGLLALAALAVGTLSLVNDLGMWGALVLHQDFSRRAQGTVLTIMVVSRTVLTAAALVFAQFADGIFDEPRLTGVLSALSATILIGSVTWFYDALLHRELEFGKRFASEIANSFVYTVVAISLAALGAGVWSLVVGQIVALLVQTAMVVSLSPYLVRPAYDREARRKAVASGRGFVVQGGVAFLSQNADYFAVGKVLGAAQLGLYSMAYRLGMVPAGAIADPASQVTFPSFARMRNRGEDIARPFLSVLRLVALAACPLGLLLSATADPFTEALLGHKWAGMVGALTVLGIWGTVRPVQLTIAWLLNSMDEANLMGTIAAAFLVLLVPGVFLAANLSGIVAVAWVMTANLTCSLFVLSHLARTRAGVAIGRQWAAVRPVVVAAVPCWIAARLVADALDGAPAFVALVLACTAGLAAFAAVVTAMDRGALPDAVRQARRVFGPKVKATDPVPPTPAEAMPDPVALEGLAEPDART